MIITVNGVTDKRPIVHTLLNTLAPTGEVIIITPDIHYKRLIEDGSDAGYFNNTFICVTNLSPDNVWAELEKSPDEFDHIIYDLGLQSPEDCNSDLKIFVAGSMLSDDEKEFVALFEETFKIYLNYAPARLSKDFKTVKVPSTYLRDIEITENSRKKYKQADIIKMLAQLLSTQIGVPVNQLIKFAKGR